MFTIAAAIFCRYSMLISVVAMLLQATPAITYTSAIHAYVHTRQAKLTTGEHA